MIKSIFKHLLVFAGLVMAISSFNGCSGSAGANNANSNGNSNANASNANGNSNGYSSVATADYQPVGSGLANAELPLLDGTSTKIADKKGKVLLVNIWGTWCGPCIGEMPMFMELQDKYRDKGLEVIGVNIGDGSGGSESTADIKRFAAEKKLNYTVTASTPNLNKEFYKISHQEVVPQTIIIDREGRLRNGFVGGGPSISDGIRTAIDKVMAEQ
ncbi:MAG: TlpA family protein disulfide reductase [Acidobacteria bacterium]|nr:TlpA family protein disulfide reductase [Acidobacteriota bacterium]